MKELSIEQKAKAYDNIIEKATKMHNEDCEACQMCIEELIPELAESEDEKIRKEIISMSQTLGKTEWLAWLEKQYKKYEEIILLKDKIESLESARIAMQECHRLELEKLEKQGEQKPAEKTTWYDNMDDLIADAMIDDIKNADMPEHCKHNRLTWINKHRSKSAEWSDEDEEQFSFCCAAIELSNYSSDEYRNYAISFLESLKDRVQPQTKYKWSEEDELMVVAITKTIADAEGENGWNCVYLNEKNVYFSDIKDWLKSLKDRVQPQPKQEWKPSEEQMVALDGICSYIRNKADWEISQDMVSDLYKLSEQLKKLREK